MVLETIWSCAWQSRTFQKKIFFAPKVGKMGQKQGFLNFLKDLAINIYWTCSIMKIYIIYCSCMGQNVLSQSDCRIFLSTMFPEEINETSWFFACWCKFTFLGGHGQKWVWPVWSRDPKIDYIPRMNRWDELIFCMLVQIQES